MKLFKAPFNKETIYTELEHLVHFVQKQFAKDNFMKLNDF